MKNSVVSPFSKKKSVHASRADIGKISFVGSVAQLVEHLTFNQVVQGSIPCRPTNKINKKSFGGQP